MCLIVRLAVGLRQCCIGDVRTFRVLGDIGHLSWRHFPHLTVNFVRHLLNYLIISSIILCDVMCCTGLKLRQHMYNVLQHCIVLTSVIG